MSEHLPDGDRAVVPEEKIWQYLLNPYHPDGCHKLRVFKAALGIGPDDGDHMIEQLKLGARHGIVTSTRSVTGCTLYEVCFDMQGLNERRTRLRSAWKIADAGGPPSFVTAYLDKRASRA